MNTNLESYLSFFRNLKSVADISEPFLLSQLASRNRQTVWAAIVLLRQFGARLSVEPLKECCLRPIRDIQVVSIFTLQVIEGSRIADFAASLLQEKRYREKWAAMIVACETCDESHHSTLEKRIKKVASRQRACPDVGGINGKTTEILHFLQYLKRTGQTLGGVGSLLLERQSRLTPHEVSAIEAAIQTERQTTGQTEDPGHL